MKKVFIFAFFTVCLLTAMVNIAYAADSTYLKTNLVEGYDGDALDKWTAVTTGGYTDLWTQFDSVSSGGSPPLSSFDNPVNGGDGDEFYDFYNSVPPDIYKGELQQDIQLYDTDDLYLRINNDNVALNASAFAFKSFEGDSAELEIRFFDGTVQLEADGAHVAALSSVTAWDEIGMDNIHIPRNTTKIRVILRAVCIASGSYMDFDGIDVELHYIPSISIDNPTENRTYNGTQSVVISGTASDPEGRPVAVSAAIDGKTQSATVESGSAWSFSWNVSTLGIADGTYTNITVTADNGDGTNTAAYTGTLTVDKTAPAISSISRSNPVNSSTSATDVTYYVIFSEGVTGVDASDFILTASGPSGTVDSVTANGAAEYTVTVVNISGNGTLRLDLKGSGTGITDMAGNNIAAGYSGGEEYVIDTIPPTGGGISINGGAAYTNSTSVTLALAASGASRMMVSEDSGFGGASYEAYAASRSFTLSSGDGEKTVYVKYMDEAGNETGETISAAITLDTIAPDGGSISINGGAAYTNSTSVTLTLYAEGASRMMVSEDSGFAGASYEAYAASRSFTLSGGEGTKTVYAKYMDEAGNETVGTVSDSIILDTIAPSVSVSTPSAALTSSGSVTYTVTYSGADTITLAKEDITLNKTGTADGAVEVSGTGGTRTVTISGITGDGTLGISIAGATAADDAGNTALPAGPSATFTVDNTAPTVSISAPSATLTASNSITYTVTYAGADTITLASGDITLDKTGTANGTVEVSGTGSARMVTVKGITGDGTLGISIAAATAADNAGNGASPAGPSAVFTVDNTAPANGSISINGGAARTVSTSVTLTLYAEGASRMMVSEDSGFAGASYEAYAASRSFTLSVGEGTKTVYAKYMDEAGNETSTTISASIFYKTVPVSGDKTIHGMEDTDTHFAAADFVYSGLLVKIMLESLPSHGELKLDGNGVSLNQEIPAGDIGKLIYTPGANWNGTDSFDWKGGDGTDYSAEAARITLEIGAVNDAPLADDGSITVAAGETGRGTLPAYDADGDSLIYSIVSQGSKGLAEVTGDTTGAYTYIPADGMLGSDSFTYRVYDGKEYSNTATVTVNIIPSGMADLVSLEIAPGTLEPQFEANTVDYRVTLENSQSSISVTAAVRDLKVSGVSINNVAVTGDAYGKYEHTVSLNVGANTIPVTVTAQDGTTAKTYNIVVTRKQSGSSGSPGTGSSPVVTQPAAEMLVDGERLNMGTVRTSTVEGRAVTTVTLDDGKVKDVLAAKENSPTVTISATTGSTGDTFAGELSGRTMKSMEEKGATLVVKTDDASYTLPAAGINISGIAERLGAQTDLGDITVRVAILKPSEDIVKAAEDTAKKNNCQLIVAPMIFEITCTNGNTTVEVSKFNGYVERTVAIPDGADPSKVTTGVTLNADGTFTHVPTRITVINGKYHARINSLTNSAYLLIYAPGKFADTEGHWAEEAVNDMASRLVIDGVDQEDFAPDRDITRAEFAAALVRALGLRPQPGTSGFDDIKSVDRYSGYIKTAVEYRLISGYGGGKFGPMDKITREQAMTMIAKAMEITGLKPELGAEEAEKLLAGFKDGDSASGYARSSIAECIKAGIISGKGSAGVAPKDNITRAEAAVMVRKLLQNSKLI